MPTRTKTQETEAVSLVEQTSALALPGAPGAPVLRGPRTAVAQWESPNWDEARVKLLRKQIAPETASDLEVEFFIAWCKRTGLDPFVKQAYFVERGGRVTIQGREQWVTKHEPMASEAGMAARCDSMPDFRGIRGSAVYAGDEFKVDPTNGTVTHVWTLEARKKAGNILLGAWAHAKREGRTIPITWLPLESRIQKTREGKPNKFWATMPEGQILKCARAEQYRLAYPNIFSGVYIEEEMPTEERDVTPPPAAPVTSKVDALAETLAKARRIEGAATPAAFNREQAESVVERAEVDSETALGLRSWPDMPPELAKQRWKEGFVAPEFLATWRQEKGYPATAPWDKPAEKPAAEPARPPLEPTLRWGPHKGKLPESLTTADLHEQQAVGQAQVKRDPKAAWSEDVIADLATIAKLLEEREAALNTEPGSEG